MTTLRQLIERLEDVAWKFSTAGIPIKLHETDFDIIDISTKYVEDEDGVIRNIYVNMEITTDNGNKHF